MFLVLFVSINKSLVSYQSSQKSVENRINAMLGFYDNVIFDSQGSTNIICRRAIASAINYITLNGKALSSSNYTIVELMTNGSIDTIHQDFMNNTIIGDWENKIEGLGGQQGFQTNISINDIVIQPADSFHLSLSYNISVNLSDTMTETNLTKTSRQSLLVNIENFEDPLYRLNTRGLVVNTIKESPHWLHYSSTDLSNLTDDLTNSYYHRSLNGASFLDRLEGRLNQTNSPYKSPTTAPIGLESFVNKDKMPEDLLKQYATNVDYLYFSGSAVTVHQIKGDIASNFRLDNQTTIEGKGHLDIYNVTNDMTLIS
jgi:hypothetical protein